jgi:calcium-dependent protein kinase
MHVFRYCKDISEQFSLGKVLGKGQFGTTRIAVQKTTGDKLACKTISKRKVVRKQVWLSLDSRAW